MTTPVSGSSLPQARDVHQHNHFHNSRDSHHYHHHTHHKKHHARSQTNSNKRGRKRTDTDEPTTIVETVSVLQLIDSSGATLTLQTLTPSSSAPATTASDVTAVDPASTGSVSTLGLPTSSSGTSDDELSTSIPTIDPTVAPSESSMPTSFPTLSYSPLTSAPLSGSPAFPSLAGVTNTTQVPTSSLFPNSTSSSTSLIHSFSEESFNSSSTESVLASSLFSSGSSSSTSTSTSATTTTNSKSASTSSFESFGTASATSTGDGGFGAGGNAQPTSSSTSSTGDDSGSSDGPGAATVAGSVLGGVAALAFLLILALAFLRWKKRQNTIKLLRGSTSERGPGGVLVGNTGPAGGGGAGGMSEQRRSLPFAIPAALASLTGAKRFSGRSVASSDGGERGFSKVSGRKLPPVLQFGGDGYSDPRDNPRNNPRDTVLSDQSIDYRDSQAFPGFMASGPTRLAVGTPMRPDSGIPVFNPGPARTPVQEQGPFSPYTDHSPLEPPNRDPLGRSHPSHDGSNRSHGSASRFTEEL